MPIDRGTALAIGLVALVTFASRVIGALAMSRASISPATIRFLDATAASVIAEIVASAVAQHGLREGTAVLCAMLVMAFARSAIWAMLAGIAVAAAWRLTTG